MRATAVSSSTIKMRSCAILFWCRYLRSHSQHKPLQSGKSNKAAFNGAGLRADSRKVAADVRRRISQQVEVRLLTSAATVSWQVLESALGSARLTQRQRTQTFLAVITLRSATVAKNSI